MGTDSGLGTVCTVARGFSEAKIIIGAEIDIISILACVLIGDVAVGGKTFFQQHMRTCTARDGAIPAISDAHIDGPFEKGFKVAIQWRKIQHLLMLFVSGNLLPTNTGHDITDMSHTIQHSVSQISKQRNPPRRGLKFFYHLPEKKGTEQQGQR